MKESYPIDFKRLHIIKKTAKTHRAKKRAHLTAAQTRELVLIHLGNKCRRCGITDRRVLQIDHVNGGGNQEVKAIGQYGIHKKILSGNHDTEYQLLCANCNCIKRVEKEEYKRKIINTGA